MDKLFTVKQMADRYGCSMPTARKYLRQCLPHMEDPLVAPEWAVVEWEEKRMVNPSTIRRRTADNYKAGRIIVPRTR